MPDNPGRGIVHELGSRLSFILHSKYNGLSRKIRVRTTRDRFRIRKEGSIHEGP
jgi:hypothetical protein